MKTKAVAVDVKSLDDDGRFEAYASVFGNVDSYGDVVVKGAFTKTLADDYGDDGAGVPIYWRHRMDDPFLNLGSTISAKEDEHGLLVSAQLDLETPAAAQTYRLMKSGRVRQMSFAYDVVEGAFVDRKPEEGGGYYELRALKLHEISVVPVGANDQTEILSVKSALDAVDAVTRDLHDGRTLAPSERAALVKSMSLLVDAIPAGSDDTKDVESDDDSSTVNAEEPATVNAEESSSKSASARAVAIATMQRVRMYAERGITP